MLKLYPKQLKAIFRLALHEENAIIGEGNPFVINLSGIQSYIFLKSLSPAYFKGSPDISRIQLPQLDPDIIQPDIPLIILGFDSDNSSFVGWNPVRIKSRVNSRNNVSLYSRITIQKLPSRHSLNEGVLSTGERFYAFGGNLLSYFIRHIVDIFKEDTEKYLYEPTTIDFQIASESPLDSLNEIEDEAVLSELRPLLQQTRILDAASLCYRYYGIKYPKMTLANWIDIAKRMHNTL